MKILFICKSNAERSQMAEVLFNYRYKGLRKRHSAMSAGTNVDLEKTHGHGAGYIVSELLLSMGHDQIMDARRKQLTERIARRADKIVVLLRKKEVDRFLPEYVKKSSKTIFWDVGFRNVTRRFYKKFPPPTYEQHLETLGVIISNMDRLVRELG